MSRFQSRCLALLWVGFSCTLYAVDGVVLIDQNRALAGGVTPGDAAGFPVTLSVAGSYRLSGNLTVPDANTTAIQVTADNVTIDLNGFSILGPVVCSGGFGSCNLSGTGHGVDGPRLNLTVVNGTIRGMGARGISAFGGRFVYVEKVHATSHGDGGMFVGNDVVVTGNTASLNGGSGIVVVRGTISGNTAVNNGRFGISFLCPSSVVGNTAYSNSVVNLNQTGIDPTGCAVANNAAP